MVSLDLGKWMINSESLTAELRNRYTVVLLLLLFYTVQLLRLQFEGKEGLLNPFSDENCPFYTLRHEKIRLLLLFPSWVRKALGGGRVKNKFFHRKKRSFCFPAHAAPFLDFCLMKKKRFHERLTDTRLQVLSFILTFADFYASEMDSSYGEGGKQQYKVQCCLGDSLQAFQYTSPQSY